MKIKKPLTTLLIAGTIAVGAPVGAQVVDDAARLDETPINVRADIANEKVEAIQRGNVVETKLPWKGEPGLTIKYDMGEPTVPEKVKDKRNKQVIVEQVDYGDGGFKVDILLDEKPDTNVFCYQIEGWENYKFSKQPLEKPTEWAAFNESMAGGYTIYHKTLVNNEYGIGKLGDIPFPYVWEVGQEDQKVKADDLNFDNGQLCVTAPQEFLDNADYSNGVRIDPTFGYTACGSSGEISPFFFGPYRGPATTTDNATVESFTYCANPQSAVANTLTKLAIYDGQSIVTNGESDEVDQDTSSTGQQTFTNTFTTRPQIEAGTYTFAVAFEDSGSNMNIYTDAEAGNYYERDQTAYASAFPEPWVTSAATSTNFRMSIYATYNITTSTAETITPHTTISGDLSISGDMTVGP